ncbi:MAG: hypothetical protein AB7F86_13035 [Bdellovibrionales bacterium]
MSLKTLIAGLALCVGLVIGTAACAANAKKADATSASQDQSSNLSSDQRKSMAEMHQKMAECLKSDKSLQECQNQMRQTCQRCDGMMWHQGMMGRHHGKMGDGMGWGYCGMMGPNSDGSKQ